MLAFNHLSDTCTQTWEIGHLSPTCPSPPGSLPSTPFPKSRAEEYSFTQSLLFNISSFSLCNNNDNKGIYQIQGRFLCVFLLVYGSLLPTTISGILLYKGAYGLFFLENSFINSIKLVIVCCQATPDNGSKKPRCSQRDLGSNLSSGT